jgi:putative ABC transport system substrate-binding protein
MYIDKIPKGVKPSDWPVEQPAKFELSINAKAAKGDRSPIASTLLARPHEIIE